MVPEEIKEAVGRYAGCMSLIIFCTILFLISVVMCCRTKNKREQELFNQIETNIVKEFNEKDGPASLKPIPSPTSMNGI